MGQIDSFKRVLGIAGQTVSSDAGIEMNSEVAQEPEHRQDETPAAAGKKVKKKKEEARIRPGRSSLAVSAEMRDEFRLLAFWARREALISTPSSEELLHLMIQLFYKKYPEGKAFLERMH